MLPLFKTLALGPITGFGSSGRVHDTWPENDLQKVLFFEPGASRARIVATFGQADGSPPCAWASATLFPSREATRSACPWSVCQ